MVTLNQIRNLKLLLSTFIYGSLQNHYIHELVKNYSNILKHS